MESLQTINNPCSSLHGRVVLTQKLENMGLSNCYLSIDMRTCLAAKEIDPGVLCAYHGKQLRFLQHNTQGKFIL